mgnify:CR=1 FL=1
MVKGLLEDVGVESLRNVSMITSLSQENVFAVEDLIAE